MLNQATIIGRVGNDPVVKDIPSGRLATLDIAYSKKYRRGEAREQVTKTFWFKITVFARNKVTYADLYVRKGDLVVVSGELVPTSWTDQAGTTQQSVEIHVSTGGHSLEVLKQAQGDGEGAPRGVSTSESGRAESAASESESVTGAVHSTATHSSGDAQKPREINPGVVHGDPLSDPPF
jgi:single-strand DNA-binding protein